MNQKDKLKVDITSYMVENIKTKETFHARTVPVFMQQMLLEGVLGEYYKKYKQFPWIQR